MDRLPTMLSLQTLASSVNATEASRFSVYFNGHIATPGLLREHLRPDDASAELRAEAIKAFKELAAPCLQQGKDGAMLVSDVEDGYAGQQFCLVLQRRWKGVTWELMAFITRCRDQAEARKQLMSMQTRDAWQIAGLRHPPV